MNTVSILLVYTIQLSPKQIFLNKQEPCKFLNYVARHIITTYNNFLKF